MERGLNGRRKEIGRGGGKKSEISGENLSSERADGNIKKKLKKKQESQKQNYEIMNLIVV